MSKKPVEVVELSEQERRELLEMLRRAEAPEGGAPYVSPAAAFEAGVVAGLLERVDAYGKRIDSLYAATGKQNEINANNDLIGTTLKDMLEQLYARVETHGQLLEAQDLGLQQRARTLVGLVERVEVLDRELADWRAQQKLRIDQVQTRVEDIAARFEAWKMVGNELTERVNDHHAVIDAHTQMFDQQIETNEGLRMALAGIREMLVELEGVLRPAEPGDGQR